MWTLPTPRTSLTAAGVCVRSFVPLMHRKRTEGALCQLARASRSGRSLLHGCVSQQEFWEWKFRCYTFTTRFVF
ncbi:hypothetical protein KUCAC02_033842 [Chaenocephalus aceratus]|nr:hypothetical protein KUCAC02_033842 [Chaenocephalus aceratus]